jgi:dihydroflavonol-4-reductase
MKIFVTGATGYVGSNLIRQLLNENYDVTCLMRSPEKYNSSKLFSQCTLVKGDITDRDSLKGTMQDIDVVIHLAVLGHLDEAKRGENAFYTVNVQGTKNVLEECIISKLKRILCFSSTAAIGIPKVDLIDENTPLRATNPYGKSKKDSDELILSYIKRHNLPIVNICFPHIYGPGEKRDFLRIIKMIKKGIFPQVGFSPNLYPSVYISDAIDAIILALKKGRVGEKYIIADDDPHDLKYIRKLVLKYLGKERKFYPIIPKHLSIYFIYAMEFIFGLFGTVPPIKARNLKSISAGRRLSIEKAKREMGFKPKINLEEGIRCTIEWYKKENLL